MPTHAVDRNLDGAWRGQLLSATQYLGPAEKIRRPGSALLAWGGKPEKRCGLSAGSSTWWLLEHIHL